MNKDLSIVVNEKKTHDEQFPLLSQCFRKSSFVETSENLFMWEKKFNFYLKEKLLDWCHFRIKWLKFDFHLKKIKAFAFDFQ